MQKSPMTAEGAQKLREELQRLKFVERPRITNAIAEARALGDLKENAEYHAAREQQSFTEGRIAEIESKLATAEIIDVTKVNAQGRVVFDGTPDLFDADAEHAVYRFDQDPGGTVDLRRELDPHVVTDLDKAMKRALKKGGKPGSAEPDAMSRDLAVIDSNAEGGAK